MTLTLAATAPWLAPVAGECHAWLVPIGPHPAWLALLDEHERARAEQLTAVPAVRDTLVTSRGAQRLLGARYLGLLPAEVEIERTCRHCGAQHGRPTFGASTIDYSVSHAGEWVLIAVVGAGLVGADIERLATERDIDGLAGVTLSREEARHFARLAPTDRATSLFTSWTRKEAAMKLTGLGLQAPPNQLDVTHPTLVVGRVPKWPEAAVHLSRLAAPAGYVAALAATVRVTAVRHAVLPDGIESVH